MKSYPGFDVIRHVLAIQVMFWHYQYMFANTPDFHFLDMVPCFLAISGFFIPQSFASSRNWGHFLWKRALRVLPAFICALTLVFALFGLRVLVETLHNYAILGWFNKGKDPALWSLEAEEIIYVGFAVLYLAGAYRIKWLVWSLTVCAVIGSELVFKRDPDYDSLLRSTVLPAAFLIGNLFYLHIETLKKKTVLTWSLFTVAFVACLATPDRPINALLQCVAILILGSVVSWPFKRMPFDMSYGIYVYHFPIAFYLQAHGVGEWWPAAIVSLLVAAGSWWGVERFAIGLKNWTPHWKTAADE